MVGTDVYRHGPDEEPVRNGTVGRRSSVSGAWVRSSSMVRLSKCGRRVHRTDFNADHRRNKSDRRMPFICSRQQYARQYAAFSGSSNKVNLDLRFDLICIAFCKPKPTSRICAVPANLSNK
jgi:hypothetical protein